MATAFKGMSIFQRRITMPKNISATKICTACITIALLLITSGFEVLAEDCSPVYSFTVDGTTISLMEPVYETTINGEQFYRYDYQVEGKKPNHFNIAIPYCCGDEIQIKDVPGEKNKVKFYERGKGEPTKKWLAGYFQARVARITAFPSSGSYSFLANTDTVGETTVCLKKKNKLLCYPIQGPACYQSSLGGETNSVVFGDSKWVFKTIDKTKCLYEVYQCNSDTSDENCVNVNNLITEEEATSISSIVLPVEGSPTEVEAASKIEAPGECILWAQFSENTTRCPIIRGKKYCR
jgi:hypothetical protein